MECEKVKIIFLPAMTKQHSILRNDKTTFYFFWKQRSKVKYLKLILRQ